MCVCQNEAKIYNHVLEGLCSGALKKKKGAKEEGTETRRHNQSEDKTALFMHLRASFTAV